MVGRFAFAQIHGDIHLVQVESPISPLSAVDLKVFRHEFVTIFRFLESKSLHPSDVSILESIDESLIHYEEENDTVFLARDVMDRLRKLSSRRVFPRIQRYPPMMNISRRR
ncbi:hypothetical protein BDN72DRAFT_846425 [Pluteus cervinus]|uniref:Uncharacterized protein n=1 Tax=Pluteus cervinus TaxID=181527 RepID=A0ACD3AG20_9AGAR|nr:hypothetical protein BDN72DRAFT_846425 [Pluteus cervinus]